MIKIGKKLMKNRHVKNIDGKIREFKSHLLAKISELGYATITDMILAEYEKSGRSSRKAGEAMQMSGSWVVKRLKEMGYPVRGAGGFVRQNKTGIFKKGYYGPTFCAGIVEIDSAGAYRYAWVRCVECYANIIGPKPSLWGDVIDAIAAHDCRF